MHRKGAVSRGLPTATRFAVIRRRTKGLARLRAEQLSRAVLACDAGDVAGLPDPEELRLGGPQVPFV
jgi:hypothetical protein